MQLAKGSAEDLPSGLAANLRAFGFDERICNESIQRMGLKKTCACLAASVASRTCIKTVTYFYGHSFIAVRFIAFRRRVVAR